MKQELIIIRHAIIPKGGDGMSFIIEFFESKLKMI